MARVAQKYDDIIKKKLEFEDSPVYSASPYSSYEKHGKVPQEWSLFTILLIFGFSAAVSRCLYIYFNGDSNWLSETNATEIPDPLLKPTDAQGTITPLSVIFKIIKKVAYPLFVGIGTTVFTWMITYLDSECPGGNPPTPFSPRKIKELSGYTFHSGYLVAILNGVTIFFLLLFCF